MAWYLFLLAAAGGVAFAIWSYRKKTVARKLASEARFEKIFKGPEQVTAGAQASPVSPAEPSSAAKSAQVPAAMPAAAAQRFLGQAESLLYYLLKAGLPDLEIFAGVSLARVVGAGDGRDREQQLRRLSQYPLDFVICDKDMNVVAVVEVESVAGAEAAGDQRVKSDVLRQAGIKLIRVNPAALPRREQVRELIDGGPQQGGR